MGIFGEQGWRSGESACLPPMCPGFDFRAQLCRLSLLVHYSAPRLLLPLINLSEIDWQTGTAKAGDCLHNDFTKLVKDDYLWQLVDFPIRRKNILDLILTTIPTNVQRIHGFDDIICTDHKLISFKLDLKVPKGSKTKRAVYNFKRADWSCRT